MKKAIIKVNHEKRRIEMNKVFAKCIENPKSEEYALLQSVRKDYPSYEVCVRTIQKNTKKKTYKGLDYDYMRSYILTHEPKETKAAVMAEFEEMILISECHSKAFRYPVIKKWFLAKYPEIANFGVEEEKKNENKDTTTVDPKEEKVDETKEAAVEVKETETPMIAEMDAAA